jgi:hypothetical protein
MNANRLLECSICGALATDAAAAHLGWRVDPENPAVVHCHACIAASRPKGHDAGDTAPPKAPKPLPRE